MENKSNVFLPPALTPPDTTRGVHMDSVVFI